MKVIVRDIRNGDATELELPWESKEVILTHGPEDKLALVTNQGLIFLWSVAAERMWERIDITSYGKGGGVPVWSKTEYWLYDDPGIYFCAGTGRFALIDDAGSLVIGHVSRGEE